MAKIAHAVGPDKAREDVRLTREVLFSQNNSFLMVGPRRGPGLRTGTGNHEKDVSAKQPEAQENARVPRADEKPERALGPEAPAPEGPASSQRLGALSSAGSRLSGQERLRGGRDFQRTFRRGLRLDGRLFVVVMARTEQAASRLGLAVGRRVGSAVVRNRVKRLLREVFRKNKRTIPWPGDLVVVAKAEIAGQSYDEIEGEFLERLRRLASRGAVARRARGAGAD
jgi:ribonuclease P protein component